MDTQDSCRDSVTTPVDDASGTHCSRRAVLLNAAAAALASITGSADAARADGSSALPARADDAAKASTAPIVLPGFDYRRIQTSGATINVATRGSGPPLLLLHGYPETHLMWRHVAPALADQFTVVCMDLRGYGASSQPEGLPDHSTYSKRAMGQDALEVMTTLGHKRFMVAAHDRGARVAYRLALDHPDAVQRLALLDIVSTRATYGYEGMALPAAYFHWYFLIQAAPLPERMIGDDPRAWLEWFLPPSIEPAVVDAYMQSFGTSGGIHATCEDYRAGATIDLALDDADVAAGRRIACPTLVLWGSRGVVGRLFQPLETWRDLVVAPTGGAIDGGHFFAEEKPAETLAALKQFFS